MALPALSLAANLVMLALVATLLVFTPMFSSSRPHEPARSATGMTTHAGLDHAAHSHDAAGDAHSMSTGSAAAMPAHAHGSSMPMVMVFEYGYRVSFWFGGLSTDTIASYLAVLTGLAMLAAVHEGLAVYRRARVGLNNAGVGEDAEALRHGQKSAPGGAAAPGSASAERLTQAGLHVLSLGLAYGLMLAVMSMNAGVFGAVLLGFGLGHWAFATDRGVLGAAPPLVRGEACHGS
ncbi:hypothetical protein HXX76_009805 [Chlamydomonas incerta]|uniref:Copper transport protein n=1 Tax=Chlamydomonas incerta TaxID=51695 RepID=A0A835SS44_CHLIN|nr:hypothetical protein HXX76_009805 [Chlamydomonas incerta]|eukprot:KAG2430831.1 hypothetical protein HXX76_009805 [Chlamydomonas incerta]